MTTVRGRGVCQPVYCDIGLEGAALNKALADLLESALDAWYGAVTGWNPPGN